MQLCDAFDIPLLFLCDTPGIMVGPEVEKTALVRHASRMFVTGASLTVPFFTIVLRKGYGLGAQAMAGGSFQAPFFTVSWPTGEFGGMGLEGAVKLGFRKELAAIEDPAERRSTYDEMVARSYERGKGVNVASHFEIDDVIDPPDSRRWIIAGLRPRRPRRRAPARSGRASTPGETGCWSRDDRRPLSMLNAATPRSVRLFEEREQLAFLGIVEVERSDLLALERILSPVAGVRTCFDVAPASVVELDDLLECRNAAVVHVRRGHRDVAQRRRAESTRVCHAAGLRFETRIRIASGAVDVVQTGVVEHRRRRRDALLQHRTRKIEARVAQRTVRAAGKEQPHAAPRLGR